jgi:hypothetical protein
MKQEMAQEIVKKLQEQIGDKYDVKMHYYCYEYAINIQEVTLSTTNIFIPMAVIDICYEYGCEMHVCNVGGGYQGMRLHLCRATRKE